MERALNRAITTPVKLGYFNGLRALRVLLTPTERRRPWILYLTPGLMAAEISHIMLIVVALGPLRRLLLPSLRDSSGLQELSVVKLAIYTIVAIVSTAILTPLEVITTRLVIQRNHASAEYNSVHQEVEGDSEPQEEYGNEEEVIGYVNVIRVLLRQLTRFPCIQSQRGRRSLLGIGRLRQTNHRRGRIEHSLSRLVAHPLWNLGQCLCID